MYHRFVLLVGLSGTALAEHPARGIDALLSELMAHVTLVARLADSMAFHTAFHVVNDFGGQSVALLHGTVALPTRDLCIRVRAVAEEDEIAQPVDAHPRNRFLFLLEGRELLDKRAVLLNCLVTRHALSR